MEKLKLKYRYRLVIYLLILLVLLVLFFVLYSSRQSRGYSISTLQQELKTAVSQITDSLAMGKKAQTLILDRGIGFTLADTLGDVIYDSRQADISVPDNIASATEIVNAHASGEGSALRASVLESDTEYLFFAKKIDDYYIRTYSKFKILRPARVEDDTYFILIVILLTALIFSFIYILRRLSKPVSTYSELISAIKHNSKSLSDIEFGNDELGDVGREIASTFSQLEEAKRYKQQLSHNIAHELKTPLTGIRAYLETIISSEDMPEPQMRKFVSKAYSQAVRLSELVGEVATLNKLDEASEQGSSTQLYKLSEVNINKCIEAILDEIGYKLEASNIAFESRLSSELKLYGSYDLIYSLFKNLIDNSIEHGGQNITVTLAGGIEQVAGEGGYKINFTFSDSGRGVPEESLNRIFERFYRIDKGRTRKTGGTGLGLAIVKNAVMFHRGNIAAFSREGGGIVFKFCLYSLGHQAS